MLKNATHKEKFTLLKNWMPAIVDTVKKDLKNEHLKKDWAFVKQYFPGKNLNKLTAEEIAQAYIHVIENSENAEELAEFISNRWLLKHTDLYYFFEKELSKISSDFNDLEELEKKQSIDIVEKAENEFGSPKTYLFSVMNSVVFPKEVFDALAVRAQASIKQEETEAKALDEMNSLQDMQRSYEQQIARLTDKYEKKLQGLQKKYSIDVEGLKKQVVTLQRKLTK
ncbi:MAG: hypothetical protein H0X29_01805 [Parachlamydiaceae bacterium]|nr:hypothetical protein [Parachlamydiaceae bacterium]